jgi:uncharacterized protein involved in copper resistance
MAKATKKVKRKLPTINRLGAQPVPTTDSVPQTAIGSAMKVKPGPVPTANKVAATPVPKADNVADQMDIMEQQAEMENAERKRLIGQVEFGPTSVEPMSRSRKVKRKGK